MIQRCACILLLEFASRSPVPSWDDTVDLILDSNLLQGDSKYFERIISRMKDLGSYYRNMESYFGPGVALAFGTNLAETT